MKTNDDWWCSLHVTEKERIASKVTGKYMIYPTCTGVWGNLSEEKKSWIRNHCTKKHDVIIPEWQEGKMFSE